MTDHRPTYPFVLQLNYAGQPVSFINYQDAACAYAKGNVIWDMGDEDFSLYGGTSRMTGERSSIRVRPIVAIRSDGKSDGGASKMGRTPRLTNKNLFARDNHRCGYCGTKYGPAQLTRDHIHPTSRGGKDVWMNVITACKTCNNIKADKTPEEADMPLRFVPYVPSHAENLILGNRHILGSQLEFLRPMVNANSRVFEIMEEDNV